MSTHPNVILMSVFKPDFGSRKTVREAFPQAKEEDYSHCVKIGDDKYSINIMESDYDEVLQIGAAEGDFVLYKLVTYGYGESISFNDLSEKVKLLTEFSYEICRNHSCTYQIRVGANYW